MIPAPELWRQHEKDLQRLLGLNSTIASGNQAHDPGDGSTGHNRKTDFPMIIDCKSTRQKSFSVRFDFMEEWLQKAAELGKMFLMPIRFENAKTKDYVVLQLDDLLLLLELAKKGLLWDTTSSEH